MPPGSCCVNATVQRWSLAFAPEIGIATFTQRTTDMTTSSTASVVPTTPTSATTGGNPSVVATTVVSLISSQTETVVAPPTQASHTQTSPMHARSLPITLGVCLGVVCAAIIAFLLRRYMRRRRSIQSLRAHPFESWDLPPETSTPYLRPTVHEADSSPVAATISS